MDHYLRQRRLGRTQRQQGWNPDWLYGNKLADQEAGKGALMHPDFERQLIGSEMDAIHRRALLSMIVVMQALPEDQAGPETARRRWREGQR